jgi:hypothetical protein
MHPKGFKGIKLLWRTPGLKSSNDIKLKQRVIYRINNITVFSACGYHTTFGIMPP